MRRLNSGSTLVDLLSTVIIIGVLASTVLPAYVDLRGIARQKVIEDLLSKATYQAESSRLFFLAKGGDATAASTSMVIDGNTVFFQYGYPKDDATGLARLMQFGGDLSFAGYTLWEIANSVSNCYVRYYAPSAVGVSATLLSNRSGC